jgi:hypothetical protein
VCDHEKQTRKLTGARAVVSRRTYVRADAYVDSTHSIYRRTDIVWMYMPVQD